MAKVRASSRLWAAAIASDVLRHSGASGEPEARIKTGPGVPMFGAGAQESERGFR